MINTKGHSESTFARKAFDKLPLVQMNSQYTLGLSTILPPLECDNEGGGGGGGGYGGGGGGGGRLSIEGGSSNLQDTMIKFFN